MLKKILYMPYIVIVALLMGVILPVWKVEKQVFEKVRQYWGEHIKEVILEMAAQGSPVTKKWLTYSEKRLLHCPRMPCKTTKLIR